MSNGASLKIAQRAKDLADQLLLVLKSSGETSAARSFVVQEDGVEYGVVLSMATRKT